MGTPLPKWIRKLNVLMSELGFICIYAINVYSQYNMDNIGLLVTYIIGYNICFMMLIWTFIVMLTQDPGLPRQLGEMQPIGMGVRQYCFQCKRSKPERCHHCTVCDRCVLQMDHHCPWINTCVGYDNRKQFLLLLTYAWLVTVITLIGTTQLAYEMAKTRQDYIAFSYAGVCFGNSVLFFLLSFFTKYHYDLLCSNLTTLEDIINKQFQRPTMYMIFQWMITLDKYLDPIHGYGYFQLNQMRDVMKDIHSLRRQLKHKDHHNPQ